ncbi:MAG TPA: DUF3106 domain-containing protein [Verrucomicrobiota bacterium]|nr:DUF3106 domain-containing protein [Verrucomicrobiota bacterium]
MKGKAHRRMLRAAVSLLWLVTANSHGAENAAVAPGATNAPQIVSDRLAGPSPVATFRRLLAMTPEERERHLAIYPEPARERMRAKLDEYAIFPEPYRELRLQVTELGWYLVPLLKAPIDQRAQLLERVPPEYRELIEKRLQEWDIWPPPLKEEVLEYETTRHYLVGRDMVQPPIPGAPPPPPLPPGMQEKLERWRALPQEQRQQIFVRFQRYFEFSEEEKQKVLQALSDPQRQVAEKILEPMDNWPKTLQEQYLAAFRQFAEMSPAERQQFMRNASRWQKMSEAERQAWRDLTRQIASAPPLPPGTSVPPPPPPQAGASDRTNPLAAPSR